MSVSAQIFRLGVLLIGACTATGCLSQVAAAPGPNKAVGQLETTSVRQLPFTGEVEAWGGDGEVDVWMEEDNPYLHVTGLEATTQTGTLLSPVEAEVICLARKRGSDEVPVYDLFLGDGDGTLYHFWLLATVPLELIEVRRLWSNPDVSHCEVSGASVIVDNGPLGMTSYPRNEELDPILSAGRTSVFARDSEASSVLPQFETEPVMSQGDAADDPVVLPAGASTWIVGTDKRWGLNAYDLRGRLVASVGRGRLNNVDAVATAEGYLAAASNRSEHTFDLFAVHPAAGTLEYLRAVPIDVDDPYGLCMGIRGQDTLVFVGGKNGEVQQWNVTRTDARQIGSFAFDSQTEGCVYDPIDDHLYVGEEGAGIWRVDLATGERKLFAAVDDNLLVADVEGLDICSANDTRVLVASSQGDDSFVVWSLDDGTALSKFSIEADAANRLDGVSETDGLACSNAAIPHYPRGILVVQDGRNRAPAARQNYKVVDWRSIETLLKTP